MITNKKSLLSFSLFIITSINQVQAAPAPVEDYESGRAKIAAIMSHNETGITAYNRKNIHFADTLNLSKDLNIPQIAQFFGCKTAIGKNYLTQLLESPVSPEDKDTILAHRQECIKALVENPALKQEVDTLINKALKEESTITILMSDFFVGKTCPELKQLDMLKEQNSFMYPLCRYLHLNPTGKIINTGLSLSSLAICLPGTLHSAYKTYSAAQSGRDYSREAFNFGYYGFFSGLSSYDLYKDYLNSSEKRSKIHALNKYVRLAEQIEKLYTKNGIKSQFKISDIKDVEGRKLIQQLKHSRYKSKNTVVFNIPVVHSFLYSLYERQNHLAKLFACIAELDAYNAIATKIIESQDTKNKFCFVLFINGEQPRIASSAFWNVLVPNAVPSDIAESSHIILTGPNAGGKTTAIRALLQNIVLAQSFGIAAAQTCAITMFDSIHSYLNVSDDLIHGLSLFASEVKRAQDILQKIKSLGLNKKYFFALDELFTGTRAEEGEKCAYEFIKRIIVFNGVQFIYATHFNKLTQLAPENGRCTNYKVDAPIKDENNKLVYPYTVSQGVNQTNVALDIAKEANLFE